MKLSDIILEGTRKIPPTDKFEIKVPNRKTGSPEKLIFLRGDLKFGETDTGKVKGNTRTYRDFGAATGKTLGDYVTKIKSALKKVGIDPNNLPGDSLKEQYAAVIHAVRAASAEKEVARDEATQAIQAMLKKEKHYTNRNGEKKPVTSYSGNEFYGILYAGIYLPHQKIIDSPGFSKWRDEQNIGRGLDYLRSKHNVNLKGIPGVDKMNNMDDPRVTFSVNLKNDSANGLYVWVVDGKVVYIGKAGGNSSNKTSTRLSGDYGSLGSSFPFGGSLNFKNNLLSNHVIGLTQAEAQEKVQIYSADLSNIAHFDGKKDIEYYEQEAIAWAESKAKPSSHIEKDKETGDLTSRKKLEKDKSHLSHRWNLKETEK
jgi:hypothetical protein